MAPVNPPLVFIGMERSDNNFESDCDISQIVMKCGSATFNKYIDPTKEISKEITKINHLVIHNGQIYKDRVLKRSLPINVVLEQLYQYLKKLGGPCTLITHKCYFSTIVPLIRAIRDLGMENKFASVIAGFTDTFDMFKAKFPNANPKQLNIHAIAIDINLRAQQSLSCGRNIKDNAKILEKVAKHHFTPEELKAKRSFYSQLEGTERFTAKMCQTACCPVVADCFVFEEKLAEHPLNKKKALKKQAKKGINTTEQHNDDLCEIKKESENVDTSFENEAKPAKVRSQKTTKKGKGKKSKKAKDRLEEC